MKKPVFAFTVSICAIALTVGAALAKPMDHGAQMSFEALDGNADGQISRDEMARAVRTISQGRMPMGTERSVSRNWKIRRWNRQNRTPDG